MNQFYKQSNLKLPNRVYAYTMHCISEIGDDYYHGAFSMIFVLLVPTCIAHDLHGVPLRFAQSLHSPKALRWVLRKGLYHFATSVFALLLQI